jgi:hypothetical protein
VVWVGPFFGSPSHLGNKAHQGRTQKTFIRTSSASLMCVRGSAIPDSPNVREIPKYIVLNITKGRAFSCEKIGFRGDLRTHLLSTRLLVSDRVHCWCVLAGVSPRLPEWRPRAAFCSVCSPQTLFSSKDCKRIVRRQRHEAQPTYRITYTVLTSLTLGLV